MRAYLSTLITCGVLACAPQTLLAQSAADYPSKPIKFVVPYPPGGLGDTFSRALARGLNERLGQPIVVENKAGANQIIGVEQVLRAPADGYTVFLG